MVNLLFPIEKNDSWSIQFLLLSRVCKKYKINPENAYVFKNNRQIKPPTTTTTTITITKIQISIRTNDQKIKGWFYNTDTYSLLKVYLKGIWNEIVDLKETLLYERT